MQVIRPFKTDDVGGAFLSEDASEEFFRHSHGIGTNEWTLCNVACEEWNYTNYTEEKVITCPKCLAEIRHYRTYKGKA